jgi:RNA polymerase sigma factor (sigma-70 family)
MTEPLTAEEEVRLVEEMRTGSKAARDKLCASMLPMVRSVARTLAGVLPREDLEQEGHVALLVALDAYDPARGRLAPYAYARIRGALLDALEAAKRREPPWESGVDDDTPEDAAARAEWAARAAAALNQFELGVVLMRRDGLTWKRIAYRLGISAVAARQIGSRAMRKLRGVE